MRIWKERMRGQKSMRIVWVGALCVAFAGVAFAQSEPAVPNAPSPQAQQTPPPNAPAPQSSPSDSLKNLTSGVAPGKGAGTDAGQSAPGQTSPAANGGQAAPEGPPPDYVPPTTVPPAGQGPNAIATIRTNVNAVEVPVVVRDKHNHLVSGMPDWRFRIYEDGVLQHPWFFSTDPFPLSVAFVIDATLPADVMQKVNQSLSAVAGALTPSDSVAVITYSGTGPQLITNFTGAGGNRLPAALEQARRPGQEMGVPSMGDDPMTAGPRINGEVADPTLAPEHGNANAFVNLPKEIHPLNDAILFAAEQLASQPGGRRRVIYVVSDGKNVRSKASQKQVLEYLLTNNISVYGTEVGDASLWGIGYLDRAKLPFLKPENVLPRYALMTGGDLQAEMSENGIQNAFVAITESVRGAYTFVYNSHQPTISGKYHNIDVRVEGLSGLTVDAKQGYYPSASGND